MAQRSRCNGWPYFTFPACSWCRLQFRYRMIPRARKQFLFHLQSHLHSRLREASAPAKTIVNHPNFVLKKLSKLRSAGLLLLLGILLCIPLIRSIEQPLNRQDYTRGIWTRGPKCCTTSRPVQVRTPVHQFWRVVQITTPPKLLFCLVDFVFAACRPSNAETDAVHNPLFANQRLKKLFSAGCHNALISWQRISLAWLESPFWLKTHHYMDPSIRITTKSNAGRITQQEYHLRQQSVTSFSKQRAMER